MVRLSESIDTEQRYSSSIPGIYPDDISVVLPVKDNQAGVDRFLDSIIENVPESDWPKEIIIVDNNSRIHFNIKKSHVELGLCLTLLTCEAPGPASARNIGIRSATACWILFVDSDCIATETWISGYCTERPSAIAFAGNIRAFGDDYSSFYYDSQEILIPYPKRTREGSLRPMYIITANALVLREVLQLCGGFEERFIYAAGEDVDIGVRLWQIGNIEYCKESLVLHDFGEGVIPFIKRFLRYGRGNWQIEAQRGILMRPMYRPPVVKTVINTVARWCHYLCLRIGYWLEINAFGVR